MITVFVVPKPTGSTVGSLATEGADCLREPADDGEVDKNLRTSAETLRLH